MTRWLILMRLKAMRFSAAVRPAPAPPAIYSSAGSRHVGGRETFEIVQRPDGGEFLGGEHLLELEDFFFFRFGDLVDFGDLCVGEFLGVRRAPGVLRLR